MRRVASLAAAVALLSATSAAFALEQTPVDPITTGSISSQSAQSQKVEDNAYIVQSQEGLPQVATLGGGFIEMLFSDSQSSEASQPQERAANTLSPREQRRLAREQLRAQRQAERNSAAQQSVAEPTQPQITISRAPTQAIQNEDPMNDNGYGSIYGAATTYMAYHQGAAGIRPAEMQIDPQYLRQMVSYNSPHAPGTIVVDTDNRFLYLVQGNGQAIRYGVGVGRPGFEWNGVKNVSMKREWPDWRPPAEMLKRRPDLPRYMAGGPENPLGARAMYLGTSIYRIHGSNEPETIGQAVSSGCIRMRNEDVIDLYDRVRVGAKVIVL